MTTLAQLDLEIDSTAATSLQKAIMKSQVAFIYAGASNDLYEVQYIAPSLSVSVTGPVNTLVFSIEANS